MDVRLSPEQEALRDSAASGRRSARRAHRRRARRPERAEKLDAAVRAGGWRELRARIGDRRSLGLGRRGRDRRRGARPRPGRRAVRRGRRWPPTSAVSRVPRPRPVGETVVLDRSLRRAGGRRGGEGTTARSRSSRRGAVRGSSSAPDGALTSVRLERRADRASISPARRSGRGTAGGTPVAARPADRRGRRPDRWSALGLALTCADLVGVDAGRRRPRHGVRVRTASVRRAGRVVPGRAAPAGRRAGCDGGRVERHAARGVGGRRAVARRRARRRVRCEGVLLAGGTDGVRDRDPGPRRHRQHLGVPGARVPAARAAVDRRARRHRTVDLDRVLAHHGIGDGDGLR